jgi:hypothetical protein
MVPASHAASETTKQPTWQNQAAACGRCERTIMSQFPDED